MTASHPAPGLTRLLGSAQASSVMPVVRSSDAESAMVTSELWPLKERAPPNTPAADHAALLTVPLFPLPDKSAKVVTLAWSKLYAATRPLGVSRRSSS